MGGYIISVPRGSSTEGERFNIKNMVIMTIIIMTKRPINILFASASVVIRPLEWLIIHPARPDGRENGSGEKVPSSNRMPELLLISIYVVYEEY